MVYFIRNHKTGAIKIGSAISPISRLKQLQTSTPDRLSIIGVMHGGLREEKLLHARFRSHRIAREWFRGDPELLAILRSLARSGADPEPRPRIKDHINPFHKKNINDPIVISSEAVVARHVGFAVDTYFGLEPFFTGSRNRESSYQIMPVATLLPPGPGLEFWGWHLDNNPQWYPTPFLALDAFLAAWWDRPFVVREILR